jgi:hypothetical protein
MALLHCPYCHLEVEDASFEAHIKSHTRIRPDGQLTTYKTLKPEGRELGDISDVPQTYYHIRCGVGTIMCHFRPGTEPVFGCGWLSGC